MSINEQLQKLNAEYSFLWELFLESKARWLRHCSQEERARLIPFTQSETNRCIFEEGKADFVSYFQAKLAYVKKLIVHQHAKIVACKTSLLEEIDWELFSLKSQIELAAGRLVTSPFDSLIIIDIDAFDTEQLIKQLEDYLFTGQAILLLSQTHYIESEQLITFIRENNIPLICSGKMLYYGDIIDTLQKQLADQHKIFIHFILTTSNELEIVVASKIYFVPILNQENINGLWLKNSLNLFQYYLNKATQDASLFTEELQIQEKEKRLNTVVRLLMLAQSKRKCFWTREGKRKIFNRILAWVKVYGLNKDGDGQYIIEDKINWRIFKDLHLCKKLLIGLSLPEVNFEIIRMGCVILEGYKMKTSRIDPERAALWQISLFAALESLLRGIFLMSYSVTVQVEQLFAQIIKGKSFFGSRLRLLAIDIDGTLLLENNSINGGPFDYWVEWLTKLNLEEIVFPILISQRARIYSENGLAQIVDHALFDVAFFGSIFGGYSISKAAIFVLLFRKILAYWPEMNIELMVLDDTPREIEAFVALALPQVTVLTHSMRDYEAAATFVEFNELPFVKAVHEWAIPAQSIPRLLGK